MGRADKLKNPGERAKLPARYLTKEQRAQRALNKRLDTPVTAGSALTNRMLARERKAALAAQFGPEEQQRETNITQLENQGRDTANWYDAYQKELGVHREAVAKRTSDVTAQLTATMSGVRGLDQRTSDTTGQQMQASAETRGQQVGAQTATDQNNGSQVRQAMLAALTSGVAGQGQAATNYASTLENVVAPGRKVQALTQNARDVTDAKAGLSELKRREGAAGASYDAQRIADEVKNIIAQQALNLDQQTRINPDTGRPYSAETAVSGQESTAATAKANREASARKFNRELNDYGVTNGAWAAWGKSAAGKKKRDAAIATFNANKANGGKPLSADQRFKEQFGVNPATNVQVGTAKTKIGKAQATLSSILKIKKGDPVDPAKPDGEKQTFDGSKLGYKAMVELLVNQGIDQVFANVVADQDIYKKPGYVTRGTANALRRSGYRLESLGLHVLKGRPGVRGPKSLDEDKR